MRKLLVILALCVPLAAVPAFVQAGNCSSGGFSCTVTLTIGAGNSVFISNYTSLSGTLSVSDNKSGVYSTANAAHYYAGGGGNDRISAQTFYKTSAASGSTIFTCTTTDNTNLQGCIVIEFSGASVLDKNAVADTLQTGTTGTASSGSVTTTVAAEILLTCYGAENQVTSWTPDTGWTVPANGSYVSTGMSQACAYQVVASTGTYAHVITELVLRSTIGMIATFSAGGGGGVVRHRASVINQ